MADIDRQLGLEAALADLGSAIAWPSPVPAATGGPDLAARVRQRIETMPTPASVPAWRRAFGGRPARRAMVLAIAALLVLAAIAGAAVLGLPGLRLGFGPAPSVVATPRFVSIPPAVPGAYLGLGQPIELDGAAAAVGFQPRLPTDPALGPPVAAYAMDGRLSLVWAPSSAFPATVDSDIGLLVTQFQGEVDEGWYEKVLNDSTRLEPVTVNGEAGYWVEGAPHYFFYVDGSGRRVESSRRPVGDVLLWAEDGITYRIESGVGRDATIALAEGMR